jgi:hypothetical protein
MALLLKLKYNNMEVKNKLEVGNFAYAGNQAAFIRYKKGFFFFHVTEKDTDDTYEFFIPKEETVGIEIMRDDNATLYRRFIIRAIAEGTMVKVNNGNG